ncbi:hypothetical protein GF354_03705 [Candidatus Peregrinibacteria bacterium]|nr:hypothetical protein [Candidatus Peregrinibacteria bacterium]
MSKNKKIVITGVAVLALIAVIFALNSSGSNMFKGFLSKDLSKTTRVLDVSKTDTKPSVQRSSIVSPKDLGLHISDPSALEISEDSANYITGPSLPDVQAPDFSSPTVDIQQIPEDYVLEAAMHLAGAEYIYDFDEDWIEVWNDSEADYLYDEYWSFAGADKLVVYPEDGDTFWINEDKITYPGRVNKVMAIYYGGLDDGENPVITLTLNGPLQKTSTAENTFSGLYWASN